MYKKKNFNNLFDSIVLCFLALGLVGVYSLTIIGGKINENTNKIVLYTASSIIFIPMIIITIIGILFFCFEWWKIDENSVSSKKLFKKKVIIRLEDIKSVTKEEVGAVILGMGKTDAIVIKSSTEKIVIYLNKNISIEVIEKLLKKSITCSH